MSTGGVELHLEGDAVHPAHPQSALWKHHASQPCTPLRERLSVGVPEGAKLFHRLKEHLLLPPSHGTGRVSTSERLKAGGASIGREPTDTFGTEHAPAAFLKLAVGKPLLALELDLDSSTTAFPWAGKRGNSFSDSVSMHPEALEIARYVIGGAFAVFGAAFVATNVAAVVRMLARKGHSSLIPFAGGLSLVIASWVLPIDVPGWLSWCVLLFDPGTAFYLLHVLVLAIGSMFGSSSE